MRALLEEGKAPEFVLSDKYLPSDERPVMVVVYAHPRNKDGHSFVGSL